MSDFGATVQRHACVDTSAPVLELPDDWIACASSPTAVASAADTELAAAVSACCWAIAVGSCFACCDALAIRCSSSASCRCSFWINVFNCLTAEFSLDDPVAPPAPPAPPAPLAPLAPLDAEVPLDAAAPVLLVDVDDVVCPALEDPLEPFVELAVACEELVTVEKSTCMMALHE